MTREGTLAIYSQLGWIALGIGMAVLLLSPLVQRWMHLGALRDEDSP
jgi:POT family proton-dependent oligopeptide transporter